MKNCFYCFLLILVFTGCGGRVELKNLREQAARQEEKIAFLEDQIDLVKIENNRLIQEQRHQHVNMETTTIAPQLTTHIGTQLNMTDFETNRLYEQGRKQYESREFSAAIRTFTTIIERSRNKDVLANSYYWIGESYYALGDYSAARLSFQRVIETFPTSNKLVDAKLKTAMTWLRQDNKSDALTILQGIKQDHPKYENMSIVDQNIRLAK